MTTIERKRLYEAWRGMRRRCNPAEQAKNKQWKCYEGITCCERWNSFHAFASDMGPHPGPGFSLDRKHGAKVYSPENCKWSTTKEQTRNRKQNVWRTYKGETLCLTDWAKRYGLERSTLASRLERGWEFERAIATPIGKSKRRAKSTVEIITITETVKTTTYTQATLNLEQKEAA